MIYAITHHDQWVYLDEPISFEGLLRARDKFIRNFGNPTTIALGVVAWWQLQALADNPNYPTSFDPITATMFGLKIKRDDDLEEDEWRVGRTQEVKYTLEEMAS